MVVKRRRVTRRTNRKKTVVTKKNLHKEMKKVALRQCETKLSNQTNENQQLYHNRTNYISGLFATNQGTQDPEGLEFNTRNRVGDEIIARGMKFKWWLSTKTDHPNVMYNIYVFYYNTLETPTDSNFWRGTNGVGGVMNRMIDAPNPERIKILKKFTVQPKAAFYEPAPNGKEFSQYRECWLSFNNKKITYRRDNVTQPKGWDLGFAIVPYDSYGSLATDNIASFAFSTTLYFKDP